MLFRRVAVPAALAAGLLLAACGGDDSGSDAQTTQPATTVAAGDAAAEFNDDDVTFAQGMIAHHEQAIEMAEIALDPKAGARAEVVDLATRIKGAQDPEIQQMTTWLTGWGKPVQMDTSGGHDMESMEGMMSAEDMDELATLSGAAFDKMWLEMMIEHHTGAISMAQQVKADGVNADVRTLADAIISAQQGEIDEMAGLLAG